jgi:hypothetical protein
MARGCAVSRDGKKTWQKVDAFHEHRGQTWVRTEDAFVFRRLGVYTDWAWGDRARMVLVFQ